MMVEKKFRDTIKRYNMLDKGDTVIAAVSGGADSMVMLHLLLRLKGELSLNVIVCHLNHGLRGAESKRDFKFVRDAATRLPLNFEGRTLRKGALKEKGRSTQEAAREARYGFFMETAKKHGAQRVALGHTLDDQAETALMRFIKGSALGGLSGIPPVRDIFIRPLIDVSREDIEGFASENGVDYITDSTNLSTKYLRNKVRLGLIPYIRENFNCNITETLARTVRVLAEDRDFLEKYAHDACARAILEQDKRQVVLDRLYLAGLHKAVASRVFLMAASSLTGEDIYSVHVDSFMDMVAGDNPSASLRLPGGLRALREYDRLILTRTRLKPPKPFEVALKIPGATAVKGAGVFNSSILKKPPASLAGAPDEAYFDLEEAGGGLTLRPMEPGDRIVPFGMKGHKKIKEIFIEQKVPKERRSAYPLLCKGDVILWIPGIRRSGLFKVTGRTNRVLKISWSPK